MEPVQDYNDVYIHYSNLPQVLVNIYSTVFQEYGNHNSDTIEYTIYIDAPYFIYIVIDKDGKYDYYRSIKNISKTKEGYFNDLNINQKVCKSFYCKVTDFYNLLKINLINCKTVSGFIIMDLIAFYSSFKIINKYFIKKQIEYIIYKMNELVLKIPTFEELYGFSNMVIDDNFIIDKLNEIVKLNEINNITNSY